ncbi:MAG TPA: hypothetical protein VGM90_04095 [Kofleriaceae bacterium]
MSNAVVPHPYFAKLRWGMPRTEIKDLFPQATLTPRIEGRNPFTGEVVNVGGDELVPVAFTAADVGVNATFGFAPDDTLVGIHLWLDRDAPLLEEKYSTSKQLDWKEMEAAARAIADILGIRELPDDEMSFEFPYATITYVPDGVDFELRSPASEN